ncbi:hypothetical protein B0T26DRAFT_647589 [Lasiosphaeria miniovina]|uniref:Calcium channel YVC1 n=1 Tax=Lasiosphaeria miniovina TaxID=1954250 RepID=A0AA40AM85_9PEZI|nr:uncharacterized protein B0T26DRAFT_647589 [Lasiosphaeria miniovina]KAK0718317.1 hypothetical protein B0T26DRAFT_647589 [Lasiosphaeria miniovina]
MLSALLRPFTGCSPRIGEDGDGDGGDVEHDMGFRARPFTASEYNQHRHATADFTEGDDDDEASNDAGQPSNQTGNRVERDEDGLSQPSGVLPLFSAGHLDSLPIYSMTHAIRVVVQARTETTLTWDQLRSPQVSQFLVKPMQQQIRTQYFSRGTLYALMVNCLQFEKEGHMNPGNAGTSSTRAKVCELLAIKLLKEYTTRELIDALSYDFYPLQGISGSQTPITPAVKPKPVALRTSTLEVAIRASSKRFLSHPLVVQQLEAIWNGAISFYSAADQLHRQGSVYTAAESIPSRRQSNARTPLLGPQPKEERVHFQPSSPGRRSAALYDPRDASLFKLSRLRVPRYRQILSTCSLAVLICLFLAVLVERSSRITTLELVFWFWSAGFMLDEIVGFNEQGFSLYIMSFWNIFDLGILLLLIVYYCMRIYGVFLLDPHKWNQNAYDVLAANAILLLPRIFSVLDHYQYFSQLLIAFRLMAIDLAAVFVLVMVCCSGFFVFFTLSKNENDPAVVAYKIFQILMGFTPAAWEVWPSYNWMGKLLMGLFLIICHFVVVTILITVLTNSFMSIASNATQEHQFLFAINTISMVKNDALFSYIAPGNIFAWLFIPLRYCMSLKHFVWLNRSVIKATHFPLLFCIYVYEKYFLAPYIYEPTDLIDHPGRTRQRGISLSDPASRAAFFSPSIRVREESAVGFQKYRALDEVFRRAPDFATLRTHRRNERRKTQNAIRTWMDQNDGGCNSPHNYSTIDSRVANEWERRLSMAREQPKKYPRQVSDVRSAASDPADFFSDAAHPRGSGRVYHNDGIARFDYASRVKDNTDGEADGDDELVTNDEDEEDNATNNQGDGRNDSTHAIAEDYFTTPVATRFSNAELALPVSAQPHPKTPISPRPGPSRRALHSRTLSTNTILYAPQEHGRPLSSSSASIGPASHPRSRPLSSRPTPAATPTTGGAGRRSPRRSLYLPSRPHPTLPPRDTARNVPNRATLALDIPARKSPIRRQSSVDLGGGSSDIIEAAASDDAFGAVPSSFNTQMVMATAMLGQSAQGDSNRMSRLMLAKMKTLEESLGDMVREMRVLRSTVPSTAHNSGDDGSGGSRKPKVSIGGSGPGSVSTGSAGPAIIEVAGHDRRHIRRTRASKSGSPKRRSNLGMLESNLDDNPTQPTQTTKGKGKAKAISDSVSSPGDVDDEDESGFVGLGHFSAGKGNSF